MADLQTITITPGGGDTGKDAFTKLRDNQLVVANCHRGTSPPASPVEAQFWADETDPVSIALKFRQNAAWIQVVTDLLRQDLDCDLFQLIDMRVENIANASIPAASAARKGQVMFDTDEERLWLILSSLRGRIAHCIESSTELEHWCNLAPGVVDGPTTNPTSVTRQDVEGWLFANTSGELCIMARVPSGWDGASDILVDLFSSLDDNAGETAGDNLRYQGDVRSMSLGTGDGLDKTETAVPSATVDIGSANAEHDVHVCTLVIDHDDATNPVAAGDLLKLNVRRATHDGAGEVGDSFLFAARFRFKIVNPEH